MIITMEDKIIHVNIQISGLVQGVGFRYAVSHIARDYGINGFVKNLFNGDVYIEAEGNKANLDSFLEWCHLGPSHAVVDTVSISEGELKQFNSFEIRIY